VGVARRPRAVPQRCRKGNAITQAGWDLLRFTWHDLDGEPAWVLAEINRALSGATRLG
jgi:hypothetical protein